MRSTTCGRARSAGAASTRGWSPPRSTSSCRRRTTRRSKVVWGPTSRSSPGLAPPAVRVRRPHPEGPHGSGSAGDGYLRWPPCAPSRGRATTASEILARLAASRRRRPRSSRCSAIHRPNSTHCRDSSTDRALRYASDRWDEHRRRCHCEEGWPRRAQTTQGRRCPSPPRPPDRPTPGRARRPGCSSCPPGTTRACR